MTAGISAEDGMSFMNVGRALAEIRDERLYRDDYDTFEDYLAGRWGLDSERAIAESRTDGPGDPRLALIRRLDEARARRERIDRVSEAFFVIRAWNAWRTGASLKMLKLTGSAGARAFPEPI